MVEETRLASLKLTLEKLLFSISVVGISVLIKIAFEKFDNLIVEFAIFTFVKFVSDKLDSVMID
jgi:hypothetical protein